MILLAKLNLTPPSPFWRGLLNSLLQKGEGVGMRFNIQSASKIIKSHILSISNQSK
jgi:hypothetical protein